MKHVVMSTLEETATHAKMQDAPTICEHESGPMKVPHFDGKNRSHRHFEGLPMTYLYTSCYIENFTSFFTLTQQADRSYQFTLPLGEGPIAWTILEDVGKTTAGIFEKPELIGQTLGCASLHCSAKELAAMMSTATGKTITYNCVPWNVFAGFGFPGAEELANMFKFFTDAQEDMLANRDLMRCRALGGELADSIAKFKELPLKFQDLPNRIGVLGATGQQGGAVARALVSRGVAVVAITRKVDSDKAKELAKLPGVEVRQGDLEDVASLVKAFSGCDGAFVVANFWEGMDVTKEMKHYANAAEALKKVGGMKHVVMSSLEETANTCPHFETIVEHETGPMKVPHFDGKNRSHVHFEGLPTTFLYTSCYIENFTGFFTLEEKVHRPGVYQIELPWTEATIAWTILDDVGKMTAGILERPSRIGQTVGSASFHCNREELCKMMSEATGKEITVSHEDIDRSLPGMRELGHMFSFFDAASDQMLEVRDLERCREIGGELCSPVEAFRKLKLNFAHLPPAKIAVIGADSKVGKSIALRLLSGPPLRGEGREAPVVVAIGREQDSVAWSELDEHVRFNKIPNVEFRRVDMLDVDALELSLAGCDGAAVALDYGKDMPVTHEMKLYENVAKLLKKNDAMKHVVVLSADDTTTNEKMQQAPTVQEHETGPMKVPRFDAKARSEKYFEGLPVTFIILSCDVIAAVTGLKPWQKQEDGSYHLTLPLCEGPILWSMPGDTGEIAFHAFKDPKLVGQKLGVYYCACTGEELAQQLSDATGQTITYSPLPLDSFVNSGFPDAQEVANMLTFFSSADVEMQGNRRSIEDYCNVPEDERGNDFVEWFASFDPPLIGD
eukprot:TRINITY_DN2767_c0_g1_i4.p1 TRINITY_DN2767_c0_g1~~TRINITY_DN2767_c0_g1_i4.p1  ORF type:complete len:980 (+),score=188.97 TRINITY_DN2767_c0_g1_i4:411-2942(+)